VVRQLSKNLTGNYRKGVEREIMKFRAIPGKQKGSHYLWHRHISDIELNPHQVAWMNEMDRKGNSHLLIGSRRIRKSFTAAAYLLEEAACLKYTECNVHSPALEQSKRNLKYMADMVLNSEILQGYLDSRLGSNGIGKEFIEFLNRSSIKAVGQASSVDGLGATHQWYEEFDDMDWETVLTRIWPTGSQIKDDHDYGGRTQECFRVVTGTIKGIGNIYNLEYPEADAKLKFNVLPKMHCYHGIAMGIIPENDIHLVAGLMTPDQFARTYLVKYVESSQFYPDKWVRLCADVMATPPVIMGDDYTYPATGVITVGIDCGGAGQTEESSNWAMTITEKIGAKVHWLYSMEWQPSERPDLIREQICTVLRYFRPAHGLGDAFDNAFLYDLNKMLFQQGVTRVDVTRFDNKPGPGGWDDWYIRPFRFTGPAKHDMHERMQKYVYGQIFSYPYVVTDDSRYIYLEKLVQQFGNVTAERSHAGYNKYATVSPRLGDDLIESLLLSVWAHEAINIGGVPIGSSVPAFGIGDRQAISSLGAHFLNDGRKFNRPSQNQSLFDLLRSE
jgi:hypothetical protein